MIILTLSLVRPWIENVVKKRCYPVCLGAKWDYRFGAYHHDWRQGSTMCLALKRKSLILSVSFMAFGSREELEEAGATYIAQEVGEIAAFIG